MASVILLNIGSANGLSPIQCQAITRTNANLLPIGPVGKTSVKFQLKWKSFHLRKLSCRSRLQNVGHFVTPEMSFLCSANTRYRADSGFAPSQWEMSLQSNTVSHWLGTNLESALRYTPHDICAHPPSTDLTNWAVLFVPNAVIYHCCQQIDELDRAGMFRYELSWLLNARGHFKLKIDFT